MYYIYTVLNILIDYFLFLDIAATISKALEPILVRLTTEVTSLRQYVQNLRKEIIELKKEKSEEKLIMPETPFKLLEDFLNFEQLLQEVKTSAKKIVSISKTYFFIIFLYLFIFIPRLKC